MKAMPVNTDKMHVIRLESKEEVIATLKNYVKQNAIKGGFISGIGSLSDVELALYDGNDYKSFRLEKMLELSSAMGNIAWLDDEPVVHLHAVASDIDGHCWAGHFVKGTVSFTAEFVILPSTMELHRAKDPRTGLNLLMI